MSSFEEIYSDNYRRIFRIALKMVWDKDVASDVTQEVFISLYDKLRYGNNILYPNTWLYRVTVNKCIDWLRKQRNFQTMDSVKEISAEEPMPDMQEINEALNTAISRLKPEERAMIVFYSEGFSYREIAEATGIKYTSVGKLLSRAFEKLGKELKAKRYELY